MSKATAVGPANIAFVKYWGARDLASAIPYHRSISMTLERCHTRTTVACRRAGDGAGDGEDEVLFRAGGKDSIPPESFARRMREQLERVRRHAGAADRFRVVTENSFPASAGLASSASGFTALTLAAASALGLTLDERTLSLLARSSGSGSAARSAFGGYVEWPEGFAAETAYARQLWPAADWDLRDVIALVDLGAKPASSLDGHARAPTSPHFAARLALVEDRLSTVRAALAARSIDALGPVLEEEATELHLIAMSSRPPIHYWRPGTLAVLEAVRDMRADGLAAYATLDAGPNVHVICPADDERAVAVRLAAIPAVVRVIPDRVGAGPRVVDEHLF